MKLVLEWEVSGGYDCGCYERTACVEYHSEEACLCSFETAVKLALEKSLTNYADKRFTFCGQEFDAHDFVIQDRGSQRLELPEVCELLAWHEKRCTEPR